ncbi:MAG: ThiF family adenylyltransferase [Nanoarchaeota archaeon]|nr:ThiF family adenylyltransferase [Nanoarchaeota archaeon]
MDTIELRQDKLLLKLSNNNNNNKITSISSMLTTFKKKHFVIIGLGGVGSNCVELLVRSGCINFTLIDGDIIEIHNLGRQKYTSGQIDTFKTLSTQENLLKINSKLNIQIHTTYLNNENYKELLLLKKVTKDVVIIDCTDNLQTRDLINSYCLDNCIDWVYSGGEGFESICAIFNYSIYKTLNNENELNDSKLNSYKKLITINHTQTANCSSGVLNTTTLITASLVCKELLLHYCALKNTSNKLDINNNNKIKCIKFNSLHNTIFEFYI